MAPKDKINFTGLTAVRLRKMSLEAKKMREAHKYDVSQQYYDGELYILKALIKLIEAEPKA